MVIYDEIQEIQACTRLVQVLVLRNRGHIMWYP